MHSVVVAPQGVMNALTPAANGRYFMCKYLAIFLDFFGGIENTLLFQFTVQKYPPDSKVNAGSVRVSVIHQTLTWTTGSLTCVRSYACLLCISPVLRFHPPPAGTFNIK